MMMMDAAEIRASFIKSQLTRAIAENDVAKRTAAIREFQQYVHWWAGSLSPADRRAIHDQLAQLQHPQTAVCP